MVATVLEYCNSNSLSKMRKSSTSLRLLYAILDDVHTIHGDAPDTMSDLVGVLQVVLWANDSSSKGTSALVPYLLMIL